MEARLAEMEDTIKKPMVETKVLHQENATLRETNKELTGGMEPSGNEHVDSWHAPGNAATEEERFKMHLKL